MNCESDISCLREVIVQLRNLREEVSIYQHTWPQAIITVGIIIAVGILVVGVALTVLGILTYLRGRYKVSAISHISSQDAQDSEMSQPILHAV